MTNMTDVVKTYAQTIITAYNAEATQVEALLAVIKGVKVCDSEIERVVKECGEAWTKAKIKESTLATYKSQTKKVLEFAKTEDNRKKLDVIAKQSGSLSQLYRAIKKDGTGGKADPSATPTKPSEAVGKSEDTKPTGATSYSEIINKMKEASAHEVATLLLTALGEDKAMQVADDILASLAKAKKAA